MDTMTLQILQNSLQHLDFDPLQQTTILQLYKTFEKFATILRNPKRKCQKISSLFQNLISKESLPFFNCGLVEDLWPQMQALFSRKKFKWLSKVFCSVAGILSRKSSKRFLTNLRQAGHSNFHSITVRNSSWKCLTCSLGVLWKTVRIYKLKVVDNQIYQSCDNLVALSVPEFSVEKSAR